MASEKPLHKRLREWAADNHPVFMALKDSHVHDQSDLLQLFADEIERQYIPVQEATHLTPAPLSECVAHYTGIPAKEGESIEDYLKRYYIPRPRYEDGEPVQFGCLVAQGDLEMESPVDSITFYPDGSYELCGDGNTLWFDKGEFVKRPAPKVLDADGVEIKVGDTVYNEKGTEYVVTSQCSSKHCVIASNSQGKVYYLMGYFLTHELPVFDAEGERIRVGDTVYSLLDDGEDPYGTRYTVAKVGNGTAYGVETTNETGFRPESVTHSEPDSLRKLRDDIVNRVEDKKCPSYQDAMLREYAARLTALIERGA